MRVWFPHSILDRRALRIEQLVALRVYTGGALFGEAGGSSPGRILALHGWGRRGSDFTASLQGLDYLALDLPGFGSSPPPPVAMGTEDYAHMVAPVLDEMGPRPLIVGHSFGGRVAVMLADAYPERVAGLILTGVPLSTRTSGRRPTPLPFRVGRWAHRRGLVGDERMESLRQRYGSADYRQATGVMRDSLVRVVNETYAEQLSRMRMPVHLLWGKNDDEVPPRIAQGALTFIVESGGTATLEELENVGHWVPTEAPAALRRVVEGMLERV
ncbi:MAG TPA: alpha/beta hydrolase [Acidimicrobiia bacterium]|nr:alpha/beta hydrolase [Acidimicrobiia bacterium]